MPGSRSGSHNSQGIMASTGLEGTHLSLTRSRPALDQAAAQAGPSGITQARPDATPNPAVPSNPAVPPNPAVPSNPLTP